MKFLSTVVINNKNTIQFINKQFQVNYQCSRRQKCIIKNNLKITSQILFTEFEWEHIRSISFQTIKRKLFTIQESSFFEVGKKIIKLLRSKYYIYCVL